MNFLHLALLLFSLLLGIITASGSYSPKVKDFLENLKLLKKLESNEKGLGYSGYWFINILLIEKQLLEANQVTIQKLSGFAEKASNFPKENKLLRIKELIDGYYATLLEGDTQYHYQAIRALDKYINNETVAYLISNNWLKTTGKSIKEAVEFLGLICGVSVTEKNTASARKKLVKLKYKVENDPHENIWFYLTTHAVLRDRHSRLVRPLLLGPLLSHRTSISKLAIVGHRHPVKWLSYQIKHGIFDSDNVYEAARKGGKQKELTEQDLWTRTSLAILNKENCKQVLDEMPLPDDTVIGTVPTFRLFTLENAGKIIVSIPIASVDHMYFVFIFGINIGPLYLHNNIMKVAHYEMDKLTEFAGWIKELWRNKDDGLEALAKRTELQISVPYLNIGELFNKNQLNEEYANKIASNDPVTLELINLAIAQQNMLNSSNQPILCTVPQMWRDIVNIPGFCYKKGLCDWDCAVTKHFRHVISAFIVYMANAGSRCKTMLESYLGYKYDKNTEPPFSRLSIDVLKNQYKLYETTYDEIIQVFNKQPVLVNDENEAITFKTSPFSTSNSSNNVSNLYLKNKLELLDKVEICKCVSFIDHPELTSDYCKEDLQTIFTSMLSPNFSKKHDFPQYLRKLSKLTGIPKMVLEANILVNRFPSEKYLVSDYINFMFQIDYRMPSCNSRLISPRLGLAKFEKLVECKADPLWRLMVDDYLKIISKKGPLTIGCVAFFMEKLSNTVFDSVRKARLPKIAIAIISSLNLKLLDKEELQDVMRDALLDKLELPVAFLCHLLKIHFKKNIFKWQGFYGMDSKLPLIDGMKILKEIKNVIDLEKQTDHFKMLKEMRKLGLEKYGDYLKQLKYYKGCLEKYALSNKKDENQQARRTNLFQYHNYLEEFEKHLLTYKIYIEKFDYQFETSSTFFEKFSQLLGKQSLGSTQQIMESLVVAVDSLVIDKPNNHQLYISSNNSNEPSILLHYAIKTFTQSSNSLITQLQELSNQLN